MTFPSPTDKKILDLLEKLAKVEITYPRHLLDATRARFVAAANRKAGQVAARPAGS